MSKQETLEKLIEPVVKGLGCELWGLEYRPYGESALLRLYIDKNEGITLEDCTSVSHQVSGVLDVEEPIKVVYTLEVSSPGVDKPLLKPGHFQMFLDRKIVLKSKWPVEGRRKFKGLIKSADEFAVVLLDDGGEVTIPYDSVSSAKLIDALDFKSGGSV